MSENIIRTTNSLCPECKKLIPAVLVEDNGAVYMEKSCPDHGEFRPRVAKYARFYKDMANLYKLLSTPFPYKRDKTESCAFTTTLRCNMKCPICFAGDENRIMPHEMTLDEVKEQLEVIRDQGVMFKVHGGEPTVRDDIADIIRLVRESGNYPVMVTNTLKLEDFEYLKKLKESGLYAIGPSLDTLDDDAIYEQMRGMPLIAQRKKVLENLRKLDLKFLVFFVCLKGLNEDQLPKIMAMTRDYPEMYKVIVLAYMHRGHQGFSEDNEYTADETWDTIVNNSNLFSSVDELYSALKVNIIARALRNRYQCFNSQTILMPRSDRKEDGFDAKYWDGVIKRFEEMLPAHPKRARIYFLSRYVVDLIKKGFAKPLFNRFIMRKKELADTLIPANYYWLQFHTMYYPLNYDETMVKEFCPFISFNPGIKKHVSFCEYYNLHLNT